MGEYEFIPVRQPIDGDTVQKKDVNTLDDKRFNKVGNEFTSRSEEEIASGSEMMLLAVDSLSQFGPKWDIHLPVFLTAPALARLLWFDTVYQKAIDVPGQIVEFGSQWGASLNTFLLLRMIREPWNAGRMINSFSTFPEGFVSLNEKDGGISQKNDYAVAHGWDDKLATILQTHAAQIPSGSHPFKIVNGNATVTFPKWLVENPEAIISHAHFDMDVYEPTREVLKLCLARMPRGAILIFDELNCPSFPGETIAVQEVLGISGIPLRKSQFQPYSAYCVIE